MHGETSVAIDAAFKAALARATWSCTCDFISPEAETEFYDLPDVMYDLMRVEPEGMEAAFCVGQKNPNATRYTCWWGETILWFLGTEESVIARLEAFQPNESKLNE